MESEGAIFGRREGVEKERKESKERVAYYGN